jgi:hypothetical protein
MWTDSSLLEPGRTCTVCGFGSCLQLLDYAAYLANGFGLDHSDQILLRAYMISASTYGANLVPAL